MIELILAKHPRTVPEIASFLSNLAGITGVNQAKKKGIRILLESALINRMNQMPSGTEIIISASLTTDSFVISITDKGLPYILNEQQKSLIKQGDIDTFSVSQLGKGGVKFEFSCKLEAKPEPLKEEDRSETLLDKDVTFRLISDSDEDILKAIRCLYAQYGYDYPHETLYNIENFRHLLNKGSYLSAIGENRHNQVVTHVALTYHDQIPNLPEFSSLVTKPFASGCGFAGQSLSFVEKVAAERGDNGVFVLAIGTHAYTQKICTKAGYSPCGIYFDCIPSDISPEYKNKGVNRFACFFGIKLTNRTREHKVCVPGELTPFISKIFEDQKTPFTVDNSSYEPENKPSAFSVFSEPSSGHFEVYISSIGSDIAEVQKTVTTLEEFRSAETAVAYLNCNEKGFTKIYEYMRAAGCNFVGFLPGSSAGDYVIMQKFKTMPNITENVVAPDYLEMIKAVKAVNRGQN